MKVTIMSLLVGLAGLFAGSEASGDELLKVGDKAPDFELVGSDGKKYKLEEFRKKEQAVVIAWFPLAFTGG